MHNLLAAHALSFSEIGKSSVLKKLASYGDDHFPMVISLSCMSLPLFDDRVNASIGAKKINWNNSHLIKKLVIIWQLK